MKATHVFTVGEHLVRVAPPAQRLRRVRRLSHDRQAHLHPEVVAVVWWGTRDHDWLELLANATTFRPPMPTDQNDLAARLAVCKPPTRCAA